MYKHIVLQFDGIDTYADVYLNDRNVLCTDNMFRSWKTDVAGILKAGTNNLKLVFYPAAIRAKESAAGLPYTLPGEGRVFIRKAQYQFGWDWGPRFVTCGIFKSPVLLMYNDPVIQHIQAVVKSLCDSVADVEVVIELSGPSSEKLTLTVTLGDTIQLLKEVAEIASGKSSAMVTFKVKYPHKWWCNGMGSPYLYNVKAELKKGSKQLSEKNIKLGLRTIELVQDPDEKGKTFYFRLNGIPVFAKGANYIPQDNFVTRVKPGQYRDLLKSAASANMNMLRVWGGGIYENDIFYDLCDSLGIMVWQDFMFACAMYPGDSNYVYNVKEEVKDQIIRLRNHPCLALWCGNNENDEGWKNWGWQKTYMYSPEDSAKIYNDYLNLFEKEIPDLIKRYDTGRAYHPSSPSAGWGRSEAYLSGDVHYWGVWWGMEPFENYREKTGRFVSEYGFQAFPSMQMLKNYIPAAELSVTSGAMKNHQKHPTGFETISKYMERDYNVPAKFEDYIYISQLLQARGFGMATEYHRKARPFCMGTLYWQLNDCWPAVSWSSTDYSGTPKALHYKIKESFKDVILVNEMSPENVTTWIVSDKMNDIRAKLIIELVDFSGKVYHSDSKVIEVTAASSEIKYRLPLEELKKVSVNDYSCLLRYRLYLNDESKNIVTKLFYFVKPKYFILQDPGIILEKSSDNNVIVKCTKYLAKDVYLYSDGILFEENFFDMLPGESRVVKYTKLLKDKQNIEIKVKSLYDAYR